jgi:ATP-binding cassette subfamily F protein 3
MTIYFHSVKKEYFTKTIFTGIRFKLPMLPNEKVGIVGKNGEGKTTLLKMMAGVEETDGGVIKIEPKRAKVFYMASEVIDQITVGTQITRIIEGTNYTNGLQGINPSVPLSGEDRIDSRLHRNDTSESQPETSNQQTSNSSIHSQPSTINHQLLTDLPTTPNTFPPKADQPLAETREPVNSSTMTIETFLLSINPYLYSLKTKITALEKDLHNEISMTLYGELVEQYEKIGGYIWEEKVEALLNKLNLVGKNIETLSGGEKSKIIFAAIQMIEADLILLDEPTNHLDLPTLQELEEYIKKDNKNYVIVSHDQRFLDNVVTKIVNIENTKVKLYLGNYSDYKKQKESDESTYFEEYKDTVREISRLELLAKKIRNRSDKGMTIKTVTGTGIQGKRFKNVQGQSLRIARDKDKMSTHYFNQKLQSKKQDAVIIQKKIDRIHKLAKPKKDWGIKIDFDKEMDSPDIVLKTKGLIRIMTNDGLRMTDKEDNREESKENNSKFYIINSKLTFTFPDVTLLKTERVAIIGPNGSGKSTFAKIVMGIIKPSEGEVVIPESVSVGYYSQTHESLILDRTVLENFLDLEKIIDLEIEIIKNARNYLHQFLFSGDQVLQKASSLSQGEKSKLALAKIIYKNPNFLLLDEPTNHLDIPSKERLEEALMQFQGAMLVISHDRYFMDSVGIQRYVEF